DMHDQPVGAPRLRDGLAARVEEALLLPGAAIASEGNGTVGMADVVLEVQRDQGFGHGVLAVSSLPRNSGWRSRSIQAPNPRRRQNEMLISFEGSSSLKGSADIDGRQCALLSEGMAARRERF